MLFNSFAFLVFFPVVTLVYFLLPHKYRWMHLLAASCVFYMFFIPVYIFILFFTIIVDYWAGRLIETSEGAKRKWYFTASLIANIGVLAVFKYYNFFIENVEALLATFPVTVKRMPYLDIILPLGLSFHTFQAMSYTIEVYRGNQKAEKHLGIYALYVMFYPQLVAGPIERPYNLLHQLHEKKSFDYDCVAQGLRMMLLGFFKKVVIADRLAVYVDSVYGDLAHASSLSVLLAMFFFAFQIYCDFSGYSDIALGSAKVMGIDLMKNFDRPFASKNVTQFWRRWHISLSTWLNDYLFTPLVVSKRHWGKAAVVFALFVTFLVSGLWHGAAWTFVVWGALHGLAMTYEYLTKKTRVKLSKRIPAVLYDNVSVALTFIFLCFVWVFFRAESFPQALLVLEKLFSFELNLNVAQLTAAKGPFNLLLSLSVIALLYFINRLYRSPWRGVYAFVIILLIIILGKDAERPFVYFQF